MKKMVRLSLRTVSLAIVQAESLRDQFKGLIPFEKISVMPNAIDCREFENDTLNDYDSNQVLFMGHMTKAKGYCDLVRAIPIVAKKFPQVRFCFAGTLRAGERGVFFDQVTGTRLKYEDPFTLHEAISSGPFVNNYRYLGIVAGQDKINLIKKSNFFVLPSYSEGFSRALLECMAAGKPVVCTPVGAHKEIVHDQTNGLIVNPGDIEMLAKAILKLLENNGTREKMAKYNYHYVREAFDISIVVDQMYKYIKGLTDEFVDYDN